MIVTKKDRSGKIHTLELVGDPFKKKIYRSNRSGENLTFTKCRCECGLEFEARLASVLSGRTKSCGCKSHAMTGATFVTHGMAGTPTYKIWLGIKKRCLDPNSKSFERYGGSGIKICDRWMNFEPFFADMGARPSSKHSIDRIDNDGNYEPGNCRWATIKQQARNRKNTLFATIDGKERPVAEWAEILGLKYKAIHCRMRSGENAAQAILTLCRLLGVEIKE